MDKRWKKKEVQTATATTSLLEITGGLAEGDEIVVAMEQSGKKRWEPATRRNRIQSLYAETTGTR